MKIFMKNLLIVLLTIGSESHLSLADKFNGANDNMGTVIGIDLGTTYSW